MYTTKTYREIVTSVETSMISKFGVKTPVLAVSWVSILARVIAGAVFLLQGYIDWSWKQPFAQFADIENLRNIGYSLGVDQKAADFARGSVTFTGVAGAVIAQGSVISRVSDDYSYQTEQEYIIDAGGSIVANVVAMYIGNVQDAGAIGNAPIGTECETATSITNVDAEVVFTTAAEGGVDAESDEVYRERVLFARRFPPQGSAAPDYIIWASSIQGVTDVFVRSNFPAVNGVTVAIGDYSNPQEPVVSDTIVQNVYEYITDPIRKPVTADISVLSVQKALINLDINIYPYTTDIAEAATKQIKDLFRRDGTPPIFGSSEHPTNIITEQSLNTALNLTPGVTSVSVTKIIQDNVEVSEITANYYKTAILSTVSFTEIL